MDLLVRLAEPAEHDLVGDLTARAYLADGLLPADSDYADELRRARHRAAHTDLLVAVDAASGDLVGTVAFARPDSVYAELAQAGEAEFRMLAVAPEARGRGVARALVLACLERARGVGAERVVISSSVRMHVAHRLYDRLGFTRLPERDWAPLPGVELVAYVHELSEGASAGRRRGG